MEFESRFKEKETIIKAKSEEADKRRFSSPKIEEIVKSKPVKNTLGFVNGFVLGFTAPYFLFDQTTGNFELVQMPLALILGVANMIRSAYGNEEQNKKDNENFLRWGVPAAIITAGVFSMPLVIFGSGASFGIASVVYHRIKDKKQKE